MSADEEAPVSAIAQQIQNTTSLDLLHLLAERNINSMDSGLSQQLIQRATDIAAAEDVAPVHQLLRKEHNLSDIMVLVADQLNARSEKVSLGISLSSQRHIIKMLNDRFGTAKPQFMTHNIDLLKLSRHFTLNSTATHSIPPSLNCGLASVITLARQYEGLTHPEAPTRQRNTAPADTIERARFAGVRMKGSELQEKRKQALLQRVATMCSNVPYPLLFLAVRPADFSTTIQNMFDIIQLFSEGLLSLRVYGPEACQAIYKYHGIPTYPEIKVDSIYVAHNSITSQSIGNAMAHKLIRWGTEWNAHVSTEFDPQPWKGLTTLLSLTGMKVEALCREYGIPSGDTRASHSSPSEPPAT